MPTDDAVQQAPWALLWAAIGLAVMMLIPALVTFAPEIYWDLDPRSPESNVPITMLGPAGLAWYTVLATLVAAAALLVHHRLGGRVRWWVIGLALVGMLGCVWHFPQHFSNQYQGLNWLAAIALATAIAHMAEHTAARRVIAVACIGMLAPLAIGALKYVLVEHPMTLEHFHQNEADFLRARGWSEGSSHHLSYVRRISFPDVTGAFGLSNVFGSIMAGLTLMAGGLAAGAGIKRDWKRAMWPTLLTIAGLVTVYLTHSKGATLALMMAAALLGMTLLTTRLPKLGRLIAPAAMAGIVLVLLVVLGRGAMGPPDSAEGERSLLFRFHYWQAAVDVYGQHPLTGVGPGRYQHHYTAAKPPINPEDVTSNHSVFIDYLVMLGLPGLAWCALLLVWLWLAGQHAAAAAQATQPSEPRGPPVDQPAQQINPRALAIGAALIAGIFLPEVVVKLPTMLTEVSLLAWMLGVAGFLVTCLLLLGPHRLNDRWLTVGLFAAAAVLLIHNQIELAYFHVASALIAVGVVALAGTQPRDAVTTDDPSSADAAADTEPSRKASPTGLIPAGVFGMTALLLIVFIALPTQAQQAALRDAADGLRVEQPDLDAVLAALDRAAEANPVHPRPYRSQVTLLLQAAWSANQADRPEVAERSLRQALDVLDAAESQGLDDLVLQRQRAQVYEQLAQLPGHDLGPAIDAYRSLIAATPYSTDDVLRMAALLWQAGEKDEARNLYQRALQLSKQAYLDPLKQLTEQQVEAINRRLAEE